MRTAEEARLQLREELKAAVDSICKHVKELGALHVAESDVGKMFLPGRSAKLVSASSELPGAVVDLRYGLDLASHAERPELAIGSPPSRRHSPWIKDEREARTLSPPTSMGSFLVDCLKAVRDLPGVVVLRCDQCLYGLVERWHLKEGGWGERQSTTSMTDLARELIKAQGLDQSHKLETRVPPCLIMYATERYPSRLVEVILRCLSIHLRRKKSVPLDAVEVGIGPHVDHDVQNADFNETRLPSQKYYDQYTGLELDLVGAAAARQSEIDFAWGL